MENSSKDNFIGLGAGGHAKMLIEILHDSGKSVYGLLTRNGNPMPEDQQRRILGDDRQLEPLYRRGFRNAFVGIGMTESTPKRKALHEKCENVGFELPPIIHPSATISDSVELSSGVQILPNATVNSNTKIDKGTIINTGAIIEHDCRIGPFSHLGPGSCLGGNVQVGMNSHIGIGATIIENTEIRKNITVGAQALVLNNLTQPGVYKGVPVDSINS